MISLTDRETIRRETMNKTIYCRTTAKGIQSFYVKIGTERYYLFSQRYYVGVRNFFTNGRRFNELSNACKNGNTAVRRTAEKMSTYLKYVEKEYNVVIYDKRDRRKSRRGNKLNTRRVPLNLFDDDAVEAIC